MKSKRKSGKEILEIYKTMNKEGVTPEMVMFYLLAHMDKIKAQEVGMDLTNENGKKYSIIVKIVDGCVDDRIELTPPKFNSTTPSVV